MSDNDTAAPLGAEPASPDIPSAGGEQPLDGAPTDAISSIRGIDDLAELERLYYGDEPDAAPSEYNRPSERRDESQIAPEPDAAPAAGENPQPADSKPEAPANRAPDRVSLRSLKPEDRTLVADAAQMVREGKAPDIASALVALGIQAPPAASTQPDPDKPESAQAETLTPAEASSLDANVIKLANEIASLREQRRNAKAEFDVDLEMSLTEQIEDKVAELGEARSQAKLAHADNSNKIQNSIQSVVEKYPESDDPDSDFSNRLNELLDLAHYRQDPRLDNPDHLMVFADQVANELGFRRDLSRAQTAPSRPSTPPPAPPRARPIGQVAAGHSGQPRLTPDQARAAIQQATAEELAAALYG